MRFRRIHFVGPTAGLVAVGLLVVASIAVAPLVTQPAPVAADGNEAPGNPFGFRSMTAGFAFGCAILDDGSVRCWGDNTYGQLGLGDTQRRGDGPGEMGASLPAVALGSGRTALAVSAGFEHTCALLDTGRVKCWGHNSHGQLGQGDTLDRGDAPGEMGDALSAVNLGAGHTALAISSGYAHSCALLDDLTVKCWGYNAAGQLGLGDKQERGDESGEMGDSLPAVSLGTGRTARSIAAGSASNTVCVLLDDHRVKCWGENGHGELGQGDTRGRGDDAGEMGDALPAVDLGTGRTAMAVSVGGAVCAVLDGGALKCWGLNYHGQLGLGDTRDRGDDAGEMGNALPTVDVGAALVFGVSSGNGHTCALLDDLTVKCWGDGFYGQLGVGDHFARGDQLGEMGDSLPAVDLGASWTTAAVTTGSNHSCAQSILGNHKCWGRNDAGQLGMGDQQQRGDESGEMGDTLPVVLWRATGVSGTVTEAGTADPLAGMWVAALRSSDYRTIAGPTTGPGGGFSAELPPGSYYLYLVDPTGRHVSGFHGPPTTVVVSPNQVTVVDPSLAATRGTIMGGVTSDDSGDPVEGAWVVTVNGTTFAPGVGTIAEDGKFRIGHLASGDWYVAYLDPSGRHRPEFFVDARGVDGATRVRVTAGAETEASESVPAHSPPSGGAELWGNITDSMSGQPLEGVWAIALHAADYSYAAAAASDIDGDYLLDLDGGDYKIEFVDPSGLHHMEWHDDLPYWEIASADAVTLPDKVGAALAPTTGALAGTVTDDVSLAPLPGVWVVAIGPTGIAGGAVTAANGRYTIEGLAPGTYRVTFADPVGGHTQEYWDNALDFAGATPIPITSGTISTRNAALHHP